MAAVEPLSGAASKETPAATATHARENAPRPSKRNSIFGSFFGKKDVTSPTKEEAPVVPAKDVEPTAVSPTAPQLEDPVTTAPQSTETAQAATMGKLDTTSGSAPATKQNVSPSASKGGIFGFMKQKEVQQEVSGEMWIYECRPLTSNRRRKKSRPKRRQRTEPQLFPPRRLKRLLLLLPPQRPLRRSPPP